MPAANAQHKFFCPACGAEATGNLAKPTRTCTYCGATLPTEPAAHFSTQPADSHSAQTPAPASALPPSLPPNFAQSPLGRLVAQQQHNPGSFVRGLRDLSDDAQKAGVFSTLGTIAKIIRYVAMLLCFGLAVLCVIGALKGRQAGILYAPAALFALLGWGLFSLGSKSSH